MVSGDGDSGSSAHSGDKVDGNNEIELDAGSEISGSDDQDSIDQDDADAPDIGEVVREFDEYKGLIRDRDLLDPNYVVEEERIVGRNEELLSITKRLRVAVGGDKPPNLFLYGPTGTGKSLITKAVCQKISEICNQRGIRFGAIELTCQNVNTLSVAVYQLACKAAAQTEAEVQVPKHGVSTRSKWDELYRIIENEFDCVVFIIDEIDKLVGRNDRANPAFSDLLYQLSRVSSEQDISTRVSVVAISNDTKAIDRVESRASSSFNPEDINFSDYDANQLGDILDERRDAFYEGVLTDDVIPLVSAFAAQSNGDARRAIDLLRFAGDIAERNEADQITENHVRAAQQEEEKNRVLEVIRGITTQKMFCLLASAIVASEADSNTAKSPVGYKVYQWLTDQIDADQHHQETYVNKMKELSTYSLVDFERRSDGPTSGVYLKFEFAESTDAIIDTILENSLVEDIELARDVARNNL